MPSMKPILQAILDTEPLTSGEIREMLMRHIMSAHAKEANRKSTILLLSLYTDVCERHGCDTDLLDPVEARKVMLSHFKVAYVTAFGADHDHLDGFFVWPMAIPEECFLPKEVCVFLGQAMGTNVGKEIKKYHADLKRHPPTN